MFVMYAEIVHVQCYRGWYVETGYTNTIFGKFLRGAYLPEEHKICQVVSKNRKLVLVEIVQTARPLETNAHANFPMAENAAYQCIENGRCKHAHIDMFVVHCACRVQCWDKVKDLDGP